MSFLKKYKLIILAVLVLLFVLYYIKEKENPHSYDGNVLVVGTSPDYPPFEFMKEGEVTGFDIDLITAISKELKIELIIKDIEFYSLIPSLQTGKINLIISGLTKTDKRAKSIDFSIPYYSNSFAFIVSKESKADSIKKLSKNAKIGVQTGSSMENFVNNMKKKNASFDIVSISSNFILLEKLKLGELDAVIMERAQAPNFVRNAQELKYFFINDNDIFAEEKQEYVVGLKKGSKMTDKINKAIDVLKANGVLDQLLKKWNLKS